MAQTKIAGLFLDPTVVSGLTPITNGAPAADYLFVWDATDSLLKKTLPNDLGLAAAAHTIESHTATSATGANLETLTNAGDADALHTHALKAPLASPTFTGTPIAPTQAANNNSTRIATTAYVQTELGDYATLTGAVFTGTVTTPSVLFKGSSNAVTMDVGNSVAAYSVILPDAAPTADDKILKTSGGSPYSQLVWGDAPAAAITGTSSGADNRVAVYDGTTTLEGDADFTWDGTKVDFPSGAYIKWANAGRLDFHSNGNYGIKLDSSGHMSYAAESADHLFYSGSSGHGSTLILKMDNTGHEVTVKSGSGMTSVTKGIAKVWVKFSQSGSHSMQASFNMTSVTDRNMAGGTDLLFDVDFSTENWIAGGTNNQHLIRWDARASTGGSARCLDPSSGVDVTHNLLVFFGDQ